VLLCTEIIVGREVNPSKKCIRKPFSLSFSSTNNNKEGFILPMKKERSSYYFKWFSGGYFQRLT
jgi:hypothetical protein